MPSLGEPILDDTDGALSRLDENLRALLDPYRYGDPGPPGRLEKVTVRNPLPRPADLEVALVGPQGWRGERRPCRRGLAAR